MALFLKGKDNAKAMGMAVSVGHSEMALGGFYAALASLAVAAMAALIKWGSHAFSTEFLIMIRFVLGFAAFWAVSLIQRQTIPYRTSHLGLCTLLAASYMGTIFCLYLSVRYIPLVDAVLLLNTAPFFAPVINRICLKQHEAPAVWVGISLGFVGVVIVLRPGTQILQVGALMGLMSGLLLAVRMVITRALSQKESSQVITFYSLGVGLIICLMVLSFTGLHVANWEQHLFPPRDWLRPWIEYPLMLLAVVGLGVLAMLQPWSTTASYEHASVGEVGPFRYTGVVFAALFDWFCWGQVPDLASVLGFLLITAGGAWIIIHEGKKLSRR